MSFRRREPRPRAQRCQGQSALCPLYRNLRVYSLADHFHSANHQCIQKKKKVIRRKHSGPSSIKSSFGLLLGWSEPGVIQLVNGEGSFPVTPTYEDNRLCPHGGTHKDIRLHSRRNCTWWVFRHSRNGMWHLFSSAGVTEWERVIDVSFQVEKTQNIQSTCNISFSFLCYGHTSY